MIVRSKPHTITGGVVCIVCYQQARYERPFLCASHSCHPCHLCVVFREVQETLNKLRDELLTATSAAAGACSSHHAADHADVTSDSGPSKLPHSPSPPLPQQPPTTTSNNATNALSAPQTHTDTHNEATTSQLHTSTAQMHGAHACAVPIRSGTGPTHDSHAFGGFHAWAPSSSGAVGHSRGASSSPVAVSTRVPRIGSAPGDSTTMHAAHAHSPLHAEASSPLMAVAGSGNGIHMHPVSSLRSVSQSPRNRTSPNDAPVATAQTPATPSDDDVATVTGFEAPSAAARARQQQSLGGATAADIRKPSVRKGQLSEFLAGMIDRSPSPPSRDGLDPPLLSGSVSTGAIVFASFNSFFYSPTCATLTSKYWVKNKFC